MFGVALMLFDAAVCVWGCALSISRASLIMFVQSCFEINVLKFIKILSLLHA